MTENIRESFTIPCYEFKTVDIGKKTIRIKGVALKGDVVSKNQRHYVSKELAKSTNTFIGKPITINHNDNVKVGTITWMDYDPLAEALLYEGEITKEPYIGLLRSKSNEIKGVSIQADYLFNKCPKCGKKFYTEEEFTEHLTNYEYIRNISAVPHGMIGTALSLVLSPEIPGYSGTTIDLNEIARREMLRLSETIIKEETEKENYLTDKVRVTEEKSITVDKARQIAKEQAQPKPIIAETPKPITQPLIVIAQELPEPTPSKTTMDITQPEIVKAKEEIHTEILKPAILISEFDKMQLAETPPLPKPLRLGEPFADYTDFADCVSKNQDKGDPEAYCASIKRQVEGEMLDPLKESANIYENQTELAKRLSIIDKQHLKRETKIAETVNALIKVQASINETLRVGTDHGHKQTERLAKEVKDAVSTVRNEIDTTKKEASDRLVKIEESCTTFLTKLTDLENQNKQAIDKLKEEYLDRADKNVLAHREEIKSLAQKIENESKEKAELKEQLDKAKQKLQETATLAENTAEKMKPEFKGQTKKLEQKTQTYTPDPLTGK